MNSYLILRVSEHTNVKQLYSNKGVKKKKVSERI